MLKLGVSKGIKQKMFNEKMRISRRWTSQEREKVLSPFTLNRPLIPQRAFENRFIYLFFENHHLTDNFRTKIF